VAASAACQTVAFGCLGPCRPVALLAGAAASLDVLGFQDADTDAERDRAIANLLAQGTSLARLPTAGTYPSSPGLSRGQRGIPLRRPSRFILLALPPPARPPSAADRWPPHLSLIGGGSGLGAAFPITPAGGRLRGRRTSAPCLASNCWCPPCCWRGIRHLLKFRAGEQTRPPGEDGAAAGACPDCVSFAHHHVAAA